MLLEGIAADLEKRTALMGIAPDETIYRLTWADVLDVLTQKLAEEDVNPDDLSDDELNSLLERGWKAAQTLPWEDTLSTGVGNAWYDIRPKRVSPEDGEGPLVEQYENASRLEDDSFLDALYEDRVSGPGDDF
ncbi:MAG TPA: hypothetical protein PKM21_15990 [Anaerolineales bacterium]|nr:hypothetical protein [Anaerolineales bacterium]